MSVSVLEKIEQYQKSIEKHQGNEEKLLYYIKKLAQLPVTVAHLQETGVGRTINSLRKSNGDVRAAAKSLVSKWKDMVAAEEEEETENTPEVIPETKYSSPKSNTLKRQGANEYADESEKKRRKDYSPDHHSHTESDRSRNYHKDRDGDRRKEQSPLKKKLYSPLILEVAPQSPENPYENGHYSESDNDELRIEDDVRDEESHSASDVESKRIERRVSQDSVQLSSDGESMKKASSSKSHSHKDSKHRDKHHDDRDKSSRKDHSSSSHKSKEEKKDKGEKSHRKHEKHKSKESSREDEERKKESSPKKSHHSSSSKSKEKEPRPRESSEKVTKSKSEKSVVKIKQEPVDTYEVTQEPVDIYKVKVKQEPDQNSDKSSSGKAEKSESRKSSSSSKSEKHKDKRKSSDKERSREKKEERKSSHKEKMRDLEDEGVDSFSGASFGDVLGMIGPTKSSKKKSLSSPSTSKGVAGYDPERPDLNYERVKSKLDRDILDSPSEEEGSIYSSIRPSVIEENLYLPEISPHYKPLPQPNYSISPAKKVMCEDEALSHIISSKQMRTKVYSGNKSGYTHVPSLFEICTRVLQDNIEALGYTGGVPYDLLKPVLEHATAEQLNLLEHFNPYLIEDTDSIWQYHCQKDFRNKKREEMETWRDMYLRCVEEREKKLKSLTSSIQNSMSKWTPARKTKLAYVEGTVKPPRAVARKQAKYGNSQPKPVAATSKSSSTSPKPSTSSSTTTSSSFGGRQNVLAAPTVSVPNPRAASSHSSSGSLKPKPKAPLMQKALQLVRNRYKR